MMRQPVFVDTHQYLAFVYERDARHAEAEEVAEMLTGERLVTTEAVLVEIMNFLSPLGPHYRRQAVALVEVLRNEATLLIEPQTTELLNQAIDLYSRREDKAYSVTDCMSMVICERHGVREVATHDHNFEQAGFVILLK